jgi:F-box/leucine-rich repeat protein 2/20
MAMPAASIDAIVQTPADEVEAVIISSNSNGGTSSSSATPPNTNTPESFNSQPMSDVDGQQPNKMKRRKRLLLSLNRISSSPSLVKMRPIYRSGGRASMSCVSLSSGFAGSYPTSPTVTSPYQRPSNGNSDTDVSQHYSTAPTSVANSPGPSSPLSPNFDRPRAKAVAKEAPSSVGLPSGVRLQAAVSENDIEEERVETIQEDYFSCVEGSANADALVFRSRSKKKAAVVVPRRPNFHFWNDMPLEIRLQTLSYLTPREIVRCSSVSKSWQATCFDGQLWQQMDTAEYYQSIPAEALIKIISSAGPFVRDLNLRGCVQLRDKWASNGFVNACSNLKNFSLEGCVIEGAYVQDWLSRNANLVHVNLTGLKSVNDNAMKVVARECPRLEHLNVTWCRNVTTTGIRAIVQQCPLLKDLRAGEVRGWDDVNICKEIFERNTLERLVLTNCESLTDESFSAMIVGVDGEMDYLTDRVICPPRKLKHLDLTRCRNLTDESVKLLAHNVPDLEGLQLAKCSQLTDDSLKEVFQTLRVLTHLDLEELDSITNVSLQAFANQSEAAGTLRHLSVSYCESVGDLGILPIMRKCVNLEEVDMDNTGVTDMVLVEAASRMRARNARLAREADEEYSVRSHVYQEGHPEADEAEVDAEVRKMMTKGSVGVSLRLVVYDCRHITWMGIRDVLSRNAEILPTTYNPSPKVSSSPNSSNNSSGTNTPANNTTPPPRMTPLNQQPIFPNYNHTIISLKAFYTWQPTINEHSKRLLVIKDFGRARRLEKKWADFMMFGEEAASGNAGGLGGVPGRMQNRRRRRRWNEAWERMWEDEEEGEPEGAAAAAGMMLMGGQGIGRRRTRSGGSAGGSCSVM